MIERPGFEEGGSPEPVQVLAENILEGVEEVKRCRMLVGPAVCICSVGFLETIPAEKATEGTESPCPTSVRSSCTVVASHTLTVRSSPAVARSVPSGEKATLVTMASCANRTVFSWQLAASKSRRLPSLIAAARTRPSGENATQVTLPGVWYTPR